MEKTFTLEIFLVYSTMILVKVNKKGFVFCYVISIFEFDVLLYINIPCIIVLVENAIGRCVFCYYFLPVIR